MSCPVEILHSGIVLSNLTLFTLLTSITTHTQVHPLVFRYKEFDFPLDFYPSLNIFPPEEIENRTRYPSSFCHFQGADQHRTKAWLSVCDTKEIVLNLHIPLASFVLKESNRSFRFETREPGNCDRLWTPLSKREAEYQYTKAQFNHYSMKYEHYFTRRRFIELAMFGDYSMYLKQGDRTLQHMLSIVHSTNSYYDSLNIELRITHLHIIDSALESQRAQLKFDDDKVAISSFQAYLQRDFKDLHYDHAVLFQYVKIYDRDRITEGAALVGKMCDRATSVSWFSDLGSAAHIGAVVAHELGHSLGMWHDDDQGTACECPVARCIMYSLTADNNQYWSNCSLEYLQRKFAYEGDYCMWNDPGYPVATAAIDRPSCGNGILDEGEDCDCGTLGCFTHDCCDMQTCKFKGNAKCAIGPCCDLETCSFRKDHLCRAAKSSCDLPETCTEGSNECPPDEYVRDGSACPDDAEAICYRGRCTSRNLQCKLSWGNASRAAKEECYSDKRANKDKRRCNQPSGKCRTEDFYCREVFCQGHKLTDYRLTGLHGNYYTVVDSECTGEFLFLTYQEGFEPEHRMGHVPEGAVCSYGKHCLKGECVSKTEVFGCDYFQFFGGSEPPSCSSENECESPNWDNTTLKMTCNAGFGLQAELDDRSWLDVSRVDCPNGKFEMYAREQLLTVAPVRFRCFHKRIGHFDVQGSAKLGALSYVAIFTSIPIVIVIIVVIVLKATGRGWIHTIILEKIRGGKGRGKKTIKSQKKMSTKSQESTKTTIKESAKASQSPL